MLGGKVPRHGTSGESAACGWCDGFGVSAGWDPGSTRPTRNGNDQEDQAEAPIANAGGTRAAGGHLRGWRLASCPNGRRGLVSEGVSRRGLVSPSSLASLLVFVGRFEGRRRVRYDLLSSSVRAGLFEVERLVERCRERCPGGCLFYWGAVTRRCAERICRPEA